MAERSGLMDLPPELRLNIYKHALAERPLYIVVHKPGPEYLRTLKLFHCDQAPQQPPLLSTNRQIRREVFPLVYRSCLITGYLNDVRSWLSANPIKAGLVHRFVILCPVDAHPLEFKRRPTQEAFSTSRVWEVIRPCMASKLFDETDTELERCYTHPARLRTFESISREMAADDAKMLEGQILTEYDRLAALRRYLDASDQLLDQHLTAKTLV